MEVIKDLYVFILTPNWSRSDAKWPLKLLYTTLIFILFVIFSLIVAITISELFDINVNKTSSSGHRKSYNDLVSNSQGPLISIFIVPLIEELGFRMPLTKFDNRKVRLSFSIIIGMVLSYIVYQLFDITVPSYLLVMVSAVLLYVCFTYFSFAKISVLWDRNQIIVLWLSILLFVIFHIGSFMMLNYSFSEFIGPSMAIVLTGFFMSFLRVKYGFVYGLIFHVLYNLMVIGPSYLS